MKPLALMAGVDTNAPTIKQVSGSLGTENNIRISTDTVGSNFEIAVADEGSVGNSGPHSKPITATLAVRTKDGPKTLTKAEKDAPTDCVGVHRCGLLHNYGPGEGQGWQPVGATHQHDRAGQTAI